MTSLSLKPSPTLSDIQQYVRDMERERGFDDETTLGKCLLLGEEVGELFRAIRKNEGIKTDPNSPRPEISHEMADILIYLSSLANRFGINLEQAFREKEEINKMRTWTAKS